ncbi:hypothetical protein ACRRTK_000143 [Alexandromys fortis]
MLPLQCPGHLVDFYDMGGQKEKESGFFFFFLFLNANSQALLLLTGKRGLLGPEVVCAI